MDPPVNTSTTSIAPSQAGLAATSAYVARGAKMTPRIRAGKPFAAVPETAGATVCGMTAEDPVEFNLAGVNQVQVKENIGLNFAAALRSFLRQDPNIILVGEIRDFETAEIAVKAALTGHLVLSTLHTNDAPTSITRLLDLGAPAYLLNSSLIGVMAQRLVRRVCANCKEPHPMAPPALMQAGFNEEDANSVTPMKGVGCETCNSTGYKGRVGLYEVMAIAEELRELILVGASGMELRRKAVDEGMLTLRMSGLRKVKDGVTTVEEVVRETVK